ncbi:hypothetical protein [Kosakonia sp. BK9b]
MVAFFSILVVTTERTERDAMSGLYRLKSGYFGVLTALLLFSFSFHACAAGKKSAEKCNAQAITEAKKLLAFYRDNDDRMEIDSEVTPLMKMKNPQNQAQYFDVLQVWGYLYKGKYRMRLIFLADCTLMGEEILEYANP